MTCAPTVGEVRRDRAGVCIVDTLPPVETWPAHLRPRVAGPVVPRHHRAKVTAGPPWLAGGRM